MLSSSSNLFDWTKAMRLPQRPLFQRNQWVRNRRQTCPPRPRSGPGPAGRGEGMTSYNRVILTGKVATLPRRRYRPDGSPVIQFPLELDVVDSTLREVKDLPSREQPQGNRRPALNRSGSGGLIDVVAFGELAEFKLDLLQGGQHLLVVGRLNQRHWQPPEGKKRTR